jgi:hypothetical protein
MESEGVRLADKEIAQAILLGKLMEIVPQPGISIEEQLKTLKHLDKFMENL